MTLAEIIFLASLAAPGGMLPQAPPVAGPPSASSEQQQATPAQQKQESPSSTKSSPTKSPAPAAKRRRRKKNASQPCTSSAAPSSSNTSAISGSQPEAGQASPQTSAAQIPTSCPPPKIVVQQGGTAEPSIQLAGGPNPDQAAQKRDAVNQLLAQTDQNLKKTNELQLSADQQDTIAQTRQFVEQSKTALATGDFERARTLAWKAEVLSENLVDPQK